LDQLASTTFQQHVQHAAEACAVGRIQQAGAIEARLPEYRLHVRERAEAGFAVIAAHARRAHATERQAVLGDVVQRVVDADAAGMVRASTLSISP
jgi:hypothetical protein